MKDDPCFRCQLPDCDERSPRCVLRRLANSYNRKRQAGELHTATDDEREAANHIFHIWKLDRSAEAAEGGRPYKRWEREATSRRRQREQASA